MNLERFSLLFKKGKREMVFPNFSTLHPCLQHHEVAWDLRSRTRYGNIACWLVCIRVRVEKSTYSNVSRIANSTTYVIIHGLPFAITQFTTHPSGRNPTSTSGDWNAARRPLRIHISPRNVKKGGIIIRCYLYYDDGLGVTGPKECRREFMFLNWL